MVTPSIKPAAAATRAIVIRLPLLTVTLLITTCLLIRGNPCLADSKRTAPILAASSHKTLNLRSSEPSILRGRYQPMVADLWKYMPRPVQASLLLPTGTGLRPDRPMIPHSNSQYAHGLPACIPNHQFISDIKSTIKPKNGHTGLVTTLTNCRNPPKSRCIITPRNPSRFPLHKRITSPS
jgi:hypothetical protein